MNADLDSIAEPEQEAEPDARFKWLDAVHKCSHLSPKTKNIGWAVFSHANTKTLVCWPNLETLDSALGGQGSSKNVSPHVHALAHAGFIRVQKVSMHGHLKSRYTLIKQRKPWECNDLHPDLQKSDLYSQKAGLESKTPSLDPQTPSLDGDGLTLSRTHSSTPSMNTEPDPLIRTPILGDDSSWRGVRYACTEVAGVPASCLGSGRAG